MKGAGDAGTKLLAVTVLTSFDQQDLADMGYACAISDLVSLRVRKAMEAGMDGLVCSPLDAATVRAQAGAKAILVTPGVRSGGAAKGDQKRVATPAEAMRDRGGLRRDGPADHAGFGSSGRGSARDGRDC